MFERYTEKARRAIFFARYEASQFGSPYIEAEHLLLGLLREDRALALRLLRDSRATAESLREEIARHRPQREKISTSVDLPLSHECKRALAYAAEESERLQHHNIGTEHLLLGLLREKHSLAAELLAQLGVTADDIRKDIRDTQPFHAQSSPVGASRTTPLGRFEVALNVANLDASLAFYAKLGFVQIGASRRDGTVLLANGSCLLALYEGHPPEGLLNFRGGDVAKIAARLQAAGAIFEKPPFTAPNGSTAALLRDPDGNAIYLVSDADQTPPS